MKRTNSRQLLAAALSAAAFAFVSCEKNTPELPVPDDIPGVTVSVTMTGEATPGSLEGTLLLNNGVYAGNNATITFIKNDYTLEESVFLSANGRGLGDTAQDIILFGDRIYIAVYGSKTIFITDRNLKTVGSIDAVTDSGARLSPRCFAAADGRLYFTYYEGWLAEYNPSDGKTRCVKVGPNPEGLACCGGRIFVANSGGMAYMTGYNNTVSVVNASEMKEESVITTNCNPQNIVVSPDGRRIYILSWGNYNDIPASLQEYDIEKGRLSDTGYENVTSICRGPGDTMYVVCGTYDTSYKAEAVIWKHDMASDRNAGRLSADSFYPYYSISFCPESQRLYIGLSDYNLTLGDVIALDTDGNTVRRWSPHGLNPQKAIVVK